MEEPIAPMETLIAEINRPLWRAAATARLDELKAENAKLLLQNGELMKILRALEWIPDEYKGPKICPGCFSQQPEGHREDCALGHALHGAFPV